MKPKAQFGPLIRTDIGIGPFADISVKDQVRDRMVHRYDMYLEAPISETSIHRIRYRIRSISDYLDPISVQEKKCGGGRPGRFRTQWTKSILRGNGWSSTRPSDIGDDSGPAIGSISRRSRRWRRIDSGNDLHLSAAALFHAMLRNGYGTYRESDKNGYTDKKQSKTKGKPKENTQKKKPYTTKKQTKRTSNPTTDRKISIPTTKAENQKLYLPKRNHARLAPGFAADA